MTNKGNNFGFKPIEDFTFDDCVNHINNLRQAGQPIDTDLQNRYDSLLSSLKAQEKSDYPSVKTIDRLEHYIKKYSNLETATKYQPQYLAKAKQELADLKHKRLIKRRIIICSSVCLLILIIGVILYVGYKPIKNIYLNSSLDYQIKFDASSSTKVFNLSSSRNSLYSEEPYFIDYNSPSCEWSQIKYERDSLYITVENNNDDSRHCYFEVYTYSYLYGIPLNRVAKTFEIIQASGKATYLSISKNKFDFNKSGASVEANYNFTITTDGSDIIEPVIDLGDEEYGWVSYSTNIISESPLKKIYILEIDKNTSAARTCILPFASSDGKIVKEVTIYQESGNANYFRIKDGLNEIYVRKDALPKGMCYTVDIETDGTSWSVVSCPNWITYRIVGNRLEINPTTWIKNNSERIQIGRFGDIILRSNNPELDDISLHISQGLTG